MIDQYLGEVSIRPTGLTADLDLAERTHDFSGNATVASTVMVHANKYRSALWIVNDSDVIIYLGLGWAAVLHKGIRLNAAGGSIEINKGNLYKGEITAIHGGTGNKVLVIAELESRYANI